MINSAISYNGNKLKVNGEGEISVTVHTHPPEDEETSSLPFRTYFLNGASNDMRVNGATTNVDFSINADDEFDYYIKSAFMKIMDFNEIIKS